ncbi:hypothetical protein [Azohydromonas aeria]|uniref:hypothetical protein n=1 Tax=Azohydromonas aeria TaxID=2590212 RepID=UPI0012F7C88F|nr:hypothetical protein [Azohydromonas aeria]
MKRRIAGAAVAAALSLLAACGGGSDGGTTTTAGSDSSTLAPSGNRVMPGIVASDTPASSEFLARADAAEAKRKEVEDQVVDGPCESDNQCGVLSFNEYSHPCADPTSVPYLLSSASAAAVEAGTKEFNDLSWQAAVAQPWAGTVMCTMSIKLMAPRCEAQKKKCVAVDMPSLPFDPASAPQPVDTVSESGGVFTPMPTTTSLFQ